MYKKTYPDGTVYYVEESRVKRESLAFEIMYKKKNGIDSPDGLMSSTSPSTSETTPGNLNSTSKFKTNNTTDQPNTKKFDLRVEKILAGAMDCRTKKIF